LYLGLVMIVPLLQLIDNLSMTLNVLWIWFTLLHLFRTDSHPQVVPGTDGPEEVGLQFWYGCMVVLWTERLRSVSFT
jgi:hypothetical protein